MTPDPQLIAEHVRDHSQHFSMYWHFLWLLLLSPGFSKKLRDLFFGWIKRKLGANGNGKYVPESMCLLRHTELDDKLKLFGETVDRAERIVESSRQITQQYLVPVLGLTKDVEHLKTEMIQVQEKLSA